MKSKQLAVISVMFCFFTMGFVDLVGAASNFVQKDLDLSDTVANTFPSLVFFWFLLFSVPTSVLMNKIGRKNTVLLSQVVTVLSLLIPVLYYPEDKDVAYMVMLVSFSLLGIGNTLMQTSLNPLVTQVIQGNLASTLTFGQFVKAIASFLAPLVMAWGFSHTDLTADLGWRALLAIYFVVGILAMLLLYSIHIEEEKAEVSTDGVGTQFVNCFKLLAKPVVLLSFLGIVCHVGIDVGTNTTAPKLLMERVRMTLEDAAFATSLYFIFRTIGCLTGSFFLRVLKTRTFFIISTLCMIGAMACMFVGNEKMVLYVGIALVGYGNSNIFSMCFANALDALPEKKNEISGLMIMGLFGGTLFPLAMGVASDAMGQVGAVAVMTVGVLYCLFFCTKIK